MSGAFIIIEGGDGAGKDTQIDLLKNTLPPEQFVFTREPGGTPLGKKLRALLLESPEPMVQEAEAFLFLADRAEHMAKVVKPALMAGKHVVSNRSWVSLVAYQVFGRNRPDMRAFIDEAHELVYKAVRPDLIVYLDITPEDGLRRAAARGAMNTMDSAGLDFHKRVYRGFQECLTQEAHVLTLDATRSIEDLHREILTRVYDVTKQ